MGIRDSIARRFGYEPASSIDARVKDALAKQPTYIPSMGFGVFNQSNPGALAFSPSVVSGTGNNKAILTEFWINPLYGQPRLIDLRAVKQLARQNIGSMAIEKILDMIAQENWVIAPKPGKEDAFDKKHAELIVEFLHKPNRNNETFESILRKVIRGILETDDGTIVKVFDEYEEAADQRQASYGYPPDKFPTKDAQMIEMFAEDGSAFLKTVDMHQYLLNYWEYSYIIPRRPVAFRPREICYISANARSGSPYGMCLLPDTRVITNPSVKQISEINIGDRVLGDDGKYHDVNYVFERDYSGEVLWIKPSGDTEFTCTPNHKIMVERNNERVWLQARDMRPHDRLVYPKYNEVEDIDEVPLIIDGHLLAYHAIQSEIDFQRETRFRGRERWNTLAEKYNISKHTLVNSWKRGHVPHGVKLPQRIKIDEAFMELLGLYLAEGSTSKHEVIWAFGWHEYNTTAKHCAELIQKVFGVKASIRLPPKSRSTRVSISSKHIADFYRRNFYDGKGHKVRNKILPLWIVQLPKQKVRYLLRGLWLGDGNMSKKTLHIGSVNEALLRQVKTLFSKCDVYTNLQLVSPHQKGNQTHQLGVASKSLPKCEYVFGFKHPRLSKIQRNRIGDCTIDRDTYFSLPIERISKTEYVGKVYDISVPDTHSFVAGGAVVSNSAFESIVDLLTFIIEAQKYNQRFYQNSAYPAFQLDLPNIKTREEMEAWGEWYRKNFMGPEKSFQALITNQNAKINPLVFSPEAVQNLETQKWYLLLALAKLKIPPSILGFTEDANRATAGQQTAMFRSIAIHPLEKIVERQLNQNIISELDPDGCCEFKFVEYTDLDEEERRSRIHSVYLDRGVISPNEVREETGRGPIKNIVLDETVRQYNDRVRVEGMDYRRGQNIPNPKKPPATDSPSHQGHRDTDEGKDRPPRKYVGMCMECVESVFEDSRNLHKGHRIMSDGKLSKQHNP